MRGAFALILQDREAGVRFYEEALDRLRAVGSAGMLLIVLSAFAGWLVDHHEAGRARGMLEEALSLAAPQRGSWLVAAAVIGLALIDAMEGDAAGAARRLGAVAGLCRKGGLFVPGQYQTRVERATALAMKTLGTRRFARLWEAGRADPWAVVAEGMRAGGMAAALGLSVREGHVLRLLARGLSDKEIAAELGISARTVSHHVAAILAKLGVRSRGEAAVRAVGDGLV